jgi:hypothetical protein
LEAADVATSSIQPSPTVVASGLALIRSELVVAPVARALVVVKRITTADVSLVASVAVVVIDPAAKPATAAPYLPATRRVIGASAASRRQNA